MPRTDWAQIGQAHRDRRRPLVLIGLVLLFIGALGAFFGPVEMYCFYLFSEGGRFHYPGFGFGCLMFAVIACQIIGYYLIAAVFIPLGYGHLRARRWTSPLAEALLWFWLVIGPPIAVLGLSALVSFKDYGPIATAASIIICVACYPVLPVLLIPFYRSRNVRLTLSGRDDGRYWTDRTPVPALVLFLLLAFYAVALHAPILLNGVFPLFGTVLRGLNGILALEVLIVWAAAAAWGALRRRPWAWWAALVLFATLSVSTILTLASSTYAELLAALDLPEAEMDIVGDAPIAGWHLAVFFGLPLLATLGAVLASKRHFR